MRPFDNGQPQAVTQFSIELRCRALPRFRRKPLPIPLAEPRSKPAGAALASAPATADHFVAYLFDDVQLKFEDLVTRRRAMGVSMQPADRAAIYTTPGKVMLDFTNDPGELRAALSRLLPSPVSNSRQGFGDDCPDIGYYMADRTVN